MRFWSYSTCIFHALVVLAVLAGLLAVALAVPDDEGIAVLKVLDRTDDPLDESGLVVAEDGLPGRGVLRFAVVEGCAVTPGVGEE